MRSIRMPKALLCLAVLALTLTACSGSSGGQQSKSSTVNVLAIIDTSGPTKFVGAPQLAGLKAATAYYNAHGGILGRHVKLTVLNDNGDPSSSTSLAIKALSGSPGKYSMVYAGSEGATISALMPVVSKFNVLTISLNDGDGACTDVSKCKQQFTELGSPALPVQEGANWIKSKGFKKVGILAESITFAQTETPTLKASLAKEHIGQSAATFSSDAVDLTSQLSALRSAGADVIYAEANGPAAGYALKARASLNWNVPILFDPAGSASDITKLVPNASYQANAFATVCRCADPSVKLAGVTAMTAEIPKGTITQQISVPGFGWESIVLLAKAAKNAHSTDPKRMVSALENLKASQRTDPLYVSTARKYYTKTNHENVGAGLTDYSVVPVGPIVNGRVQST